MRILHLQGKLLLLGMLAAFLLPAAAQADHGRQGGNRGRVVIYADSGRYDRGHYRYNEHWRRDHGRRVGWRGRDLPPGLAKKYACEHGRYVYSHSDHRHYPEYPRRYPRRGGVTIGVHIPF